MVWRLSFTAARHVYNMNSLGLGACAGACMFSVIACTIKIVKLVKLFIPKNLQCQTIRGLTRNFNIFFILPSIGHSSRYK